MQFKFKQIFSSVVKPLVSSEKDKFLALASLKEIGKFLPDVDTAKNVDLLPVAFNACVINRVNKNDDLIDTKTALAIYKEFINKPINVEHHRDKVIGVILTAGFSAFGTDTPLTEEEVKKLDGPFNITLGGLIWRIVNPDLSTVIEESNDPTSTNYMGVSASWELGFTDFKIIELKNGEKNIAHARVISDEKEIETASPLLKALGGNGVFEDARIYRMPTNDVLPLGIGFTEKPAAEVKGILVAAAAENETLNKESTSKITGTPDQGYGICPNCQVKNPANTYNNAGMITCGSCKEITPSTKWVMDSIAAEHKLVKCSCGTVISNCRCSSPEKKIEVIEAGCKNCQEKQKSISQATILNVKSNIQQKIMPITKLSEITDDNLKQASAADIATVINNELTEKGKVWTTERQKLDEQIALAKKAQETAEATAATNAAELKKVQATVEELNKKAQEREAVEQFNVRMSKVNEVYTLDDEARAAIVEEIKAISTEEAFAKWEKKAAVLLKGYAKTKPPVTTTDDKDKDKDKTDKAKQAKAAAELDEVIAKAQKDKALLVANASTVELPSLVEKYKDAFKPTDFIVTK